MSTVTQNHVSETRDVMENNDLPEGWEIPSIREILTVNYGKGLKEANRKPGKVSVYGSNGTVGKHVAPLTCGPTIIIGRKGTVGAVHFSPEPCWPIDTTYYIDEFQGLDPKYVTFALCNLSLGTLDTSTAIPGLNRDDLYRQDIPLAPFAEQKRIIAKIEELLGQVNAARTRLAKVSQILKRFRQAVLAAACSEGESTSLSEVVLGLKYGTSQKCTHDSAGAPVLRIPNIGDGSVKLDDLKYAKLPSKELAALRLAPGDILMIRSNGSVSLVGKAALVSEKEAGFAYAGYLIRLRVNVNRVLPEYLNLALQTHSVREQVEIPARSTSGVHNINSTEVLRLQINLPDPDAQKAAVRRVEALFKLADSIEKGVDKAAKRADKLTQAILAKAFRGELVPTEAELARREGRDFEPASELLAPIKAEQSETEACSNLHNPRRTRTLKARTR